MRLRNVGNIANIHTVYRKNRIDVNCMVLTDQSQGGNGGLGM
jgi:hypothetical protein